MPSLKDFWEALQAGWLPALAALIGGMVVVAGDWFNIPYLGDAPDWLTVTAVYVGVFSLSILLANIVYLLVHIWRKVKAWQAQEKFRAMVREEIQNAPPQEIAILAYLITSGRKAFSADFNDRRLAPLVSKGIIIKLELSGVHSIWEWPYVVQDDVWAFLSENKDQLIVPNIEDVGDPFNWRTSSW